MSHYVSVRTIGRGGFGVVEEVRNASGEVFARKTFSPSTLLPRDAREKLKTRFKREVSIQEQIGGHEIVPVLDSGLGDTTPWFVMPLATQTYDERYQEERASGHINIEPIVEILNALQFLHEMGYVHRDLNPKNILYHDGHWKLSDLGAVLPPAGHTVTLTEDTIIYTERYCSPEQRQDFHNVQSSSDVYAFGCILHDIFGVTARTPYARHTAPGPVGPIIEKCTELNPARRPMIRVLRELVIDALVEMGGYCKVEDKQSEEWLLKLETIESWDDAEFHSFARFFANLDVDERAPDCEADWIYSFSTPFLTRLPSAALAKIVDRRDGVSSAIIEKYCNWVRSCDFRFGFADTVCSRLVTIFDHGGPADKAMSFVALVYLGESHNRWHVMRGV